MINSQAQLAYTSATNLTDALKSYKKIRYIPNGYSLAVEMPELGLEIYHGMNAAYGKPVSLRFAGKSVKAWDHYRYATEAERAEADSKFVTRIQQMNQAKAKEKAERKALKATPHTLAVGDILVSSWGWEQTNVDFYQVVGLKGAFVVQLRRIGCQSVGCEGSSMSDMVIAAKDAFLDGKRGEVFEKRVSVGNGFKITNYARASQWDGRPMYRSWYA